MIHDDDKFDREQDGDVDMATKEAEEVQEREFFGRSQSEGENRNAEHLWLVSFSDFMTIMMIFFLAMFGYSYLADKQQKPVRKLYDQFSMTVSKMKEDIGDQIRLEEHIDKIKVELGEGVLFPTGSAQLSKKATKTLAELGVAMKNLPGDVIVEGHTDNVPVAGGRYKSNWELSAARAFSVVDELARAGVASKRLAAWGFGENRPAVPNDTPEMRSRNRRIDIIILKPTKKKDA